MPRPARLPRSFFDRSVHAVAPDLVGATLLFGGVGGIIVEVEAYHHTDPAAHSYGGQTPRNAVLIRALEPTAGIEAMRRRRGLDDPRALCSGPGKLCQALGVTIMHNGLPLDRPPFELRARSSGVPAETAIGPRIGITKAAEHPWRYGLKGSPFLSRRFG